MHIKKIVIIFTVVCLSFFLQEHSYVPKNHALCDSKTIKNIVNIFQQHTLTYDIDKKSVNDTDIALHIRTIDEYAELSRKLAYFIKEEKPIILTMVGFPYKSSNTQDKVISSCADAAERYSLVYLQNFLNHIKSIYKPGIKLRIFTDGIAFCDIEQVPDDIVMQYEDTLKIITQDLPDIEICTMRDLCSKQSPIEIRKKISNMYPSLEEFHTMLENDKKLQDDTNILTQRMDFELALLSLSDEQIANIGLQEMHRSLQYSTFLKQFRPEETISCSVHYQKDLSKKIGLKLSDSCVTAWHGVLVETNGNFIIEHLKDIDLSKYQRTEWMVNGVSLPYLKNT